MGSDHNTRRHRGQIMIIFALALVAIVGMVGLVIDGGAVFAQQRVGQNGADSAATAGGLVIAEKLGGTSHTGADVKAAIDGMAAANGLGSVTAEYTDDFGVPIGQPVDPSGAIPNTARGVRVQGSRTVDTTFARVLGFNQLTATADATVVAGALSGECVAEEDGCTFLPVTFPVKIPTCIDGELQPGGNWIGVPPGTDPGAGYWPLATKADLPSTSNPTGNTDKLAILPLCRSAGDASGAFGWLDLTTGNLADQITGPLNFSVDIPGWFQTQPGGPNNVEGALVDWIHKPVLIPLYSGSCKADPRVTAGVCPDDKKGQNPSGNGTYYYVQQVNVFYLDKVYVQGSNVGECTTGPGSPLVPVDHGTGFLGCLKGWFVDWITAGPIVPGGTINPGRTAIGIQLKK